VPWITVVQANKVGNIVRIISGYLYTDSTNIWLPQR